jgi:hypothetical protein
MARGVAVASGAGDVQAVTGAVTLVGVAARETAGSPAAASLVLRDGTDATGAVRVPIELAANQSVAVQLPAVEFATGVFVDREAGTTELVLYII